MQISDRNTNSFVLLYVNCTVILGLFIVKVYLPVSVIYSYQIQLIHIGRDYYMEEEIHETFRTAELNVLYFLICQTLQLDRVLGSLRSCSHSFGTLKKLGFQWAGLTMKNMYVLTSISQLAYFVYISYFIYIFLSFQVISFFLIFLGGPPDFVYVFLSLFMSVCFFNIQ